MVELNDNLDSDNIDGFKEQWITDANEREVFICAEDNTSTTYPINNTNSPHLPHTYADIVYW